MFTFPVGVNWRQENIDPYFSNVVLFLKGEGVNGSTNIVDSSFNPKSIAITGGSQISTTQSKYGESSIYIPENSNIYLTNSASAITITGDYTIETYVYITSDLNNYNSLIYSPTNIFGIRLPDNGFGRKLQFSYKEDTLSFIYSCPLTKADILNSWTHIALSRVNGVTRFFVNGILQNFNNGANPSSYPLSFLNPDSSNNYVLYLGNSIIGSNLTGYIDSFRITNSVGRYINNFSSSETYLNN